MSASTSIIVPAHNRAALTRRCIGALLANQPRDCEIIVVDDASTDSTAELLASYGKAIRTVTLSSNNGYARACNEGAVAASGEALLFLNNDTEPQHGWLQALTGYAQEHPAAAIVGAKLVYPTGPVQHAGVVIGQDGFPHNLYAGLPADHPAVNRSRRLQAVTGACMLVVRAAFEQAGGFDTGFVNSLEDVDLCLRIGAAGGEIHYCHDAVVMHLESASRGRQDRFQRSVEIYRERWRDRVKRDDLAIYVEDGLLAVEYAEAYPLRMAISPRLAAVDAGREVERERLLEKYAQQVADLLGEVVRLTAAAGGAPGADGAGSSAPIVELGVDFDHRGFLQHADRLEEDVHRLQLRLERASTQASDGSPSFSATRRLGYRRLVERVQVAVSVAIPAGASVLVVSRGDRELVSIDNRDGRHFPQDATGGYLGHYPQDSADAVSQLETLRAAGAEYLVLPSTAYWWLDHYAGFAEHLRSFYPVTKLDACSIYRLDRNPSAELAAQEAVG
jgi:GT2 family glycosyltransferase